VGEAKAQAGRGGGQGEASDQAQARVQEAAEAEGQATVKAEVTYAPKGAGPNIVANTDTKPLKLIKRR
jgi:hypothetical protein